MYLSGFVLNLCLYSCLYLYLLLYQCHHDVYNEGGREAEMNKHRGGRWLMLHARQLPVSVKQLLNVEELPV